MNQKIVTGILLDDETKLSLGDLSHACRVHADWIIELVEEGILEPIGENATRWHFTGASLIRARTVLRLQHDLDVNLSGAALVLDLLDELETLRSRLRHLNQQN